LLPESSSRVGFLPLVIADFPLGYLTSDPPVLGLFSTFPPFTFLAVLVRYFTTTDAIVPPLLPVHSYPPNLLNFRFQNFQAFPLVSHPSIFLPDTAALDTRKWRVQAPPNLLFLVVPMA